MTGTFDEILAYFMVPTLVFLALTVAAVFVLRRRSPSSAPCAMPGYPVSPWLFLVPILVGDRPCRSWAIPCHASIGLVRRRAGDARLRVGPGASRQAGAIVPSTTADRFPASSIGHEPLNPK